MTLPQMILALAIASIGACGGSSICPPGQPVHAAAGTCPLSGGIAGDILPGALDQQLELAPDRMSVTYRFKKDGVEYSARYSAKPLGSDTIYSRLGIRRSGTPTTDCDIAGTAGPVVDAITIKRNGTIIDHAIAPFFEWDNPSKVCAIYTSRNLAALSGAPDGKGTILYGNEVIVYFARNIGLTASDVIDVEIIGAPLDDYEVTLYGQVKTISLGTRRGSSSFIVP